MTHLIVKMMVLSCVCNWKLYKDSSMVLVKARLMTPLMVPMMALLWVHNPGPRV